MKGNSERYVICVTFTDKWRQEHFSTNDDSEQNGQSHFVAGKASPSPGCEGLPTGNMSAEAVKINVLVERPLDGSFRQLIAANERETHMQNKERRVAWNVFLTVFCLMVIAFPLFQIVRAKFDSDVKYVSILFQTGHAVFISVDSETNELEGVFFVGSSSEQTSATSVTSEIIGNQQKSLGTYEWTRFKQEGTAALPKFTFKIPKAIKEKRLNFSITAR